MWVKSDLLNLIGLSQGDFDHVCRAPSFEEAELALERLKARAKKGYKRAVLDLHPDRTAGDAAKAATLVALNDVMDRIEKVCIERTVRVPMRPVKVTIWVGGKKIKAEATWS